MERMNLEELASLVSEEATPRQKAILKAHSDLQTELDALREQTLALKNLPSVLPPLGEWADLERELVKEGLIQAPALHTPTIRIPSVRIPMTWLKVAAAILLFVGGTAFGRALPGNGAPAVVFTGSGAVSSSQASVATLEEATSAVQAAESQLLQALGLYNQLSNARVSSRGDADPAVRLAAVLQLLAASEAAVRESPADPFFNEVLVSALAERELAYRQIRANGNNWY